MVRTPLPAKPDRDLLIPPPLCSTDPSSRKYGRRGNGSDVITKKKTGGDMNPTMRTIQSAPLLLWTHIFLFPSQGSRKPSKPSLPRGSLLLAQRGGCREKKRTNRIAQKRTTTRELRKTYIKFRTRRQQLTVLINADRMFLIFINNVNNENPRTHKKNKGSTIG